MEKEIAKRYRLCTNCSDRILSGSCDGKCKEYWKYVGATEQKAIDIEKACQWITEHIDIPYEVEHIDGEPVASDYIEWCKKRLEAAKEITDEFRKAMEEQI